MSTNAKQDESQQNVLLDMRNIHIEGFSDEQWHPIIKGVDLKLERGQILGLIGESGAGKSTLGLAAMGFARTGCRFTQGEVYFDGTDLLKLKDEQRRKLWGTRIAYVAQSAAAAFNPAHRLIDQTIESANRSSIRPEAESRQDAEELYSALDLPDPSSIGSRYPHQVSGGQLQRVMTAMAMSSRPDLIIFDEPTTALDVTTQVEVLASMRKIVEEHNTAAIYITHDFSPKEEYTQTLWSVRSLEKPQEKGEDIVLSMQNIFAAYGSVPVLHDVDIKLPRGKTVAVVGESGSGKSTAARVITGLLPPSQGQVLFDGETLPANLKDRSPEQLQRIQMIYQMADTAMNPRQTVEKIIGRPIELYHGLTGTKKAERINELLSMIELDESFLDRLPAELSGGQKQRICIARALAASPDVIICDEVTSALDQIVQEGILKLLLRLQEEFGISYLFITHDIATVKAIADEIVVMYQGRVVEQGLKDTILSPPHPEYTELLLSSVPDMDPDWLTNLLDSRTH